MARKATIIGSKGDKLESIAVGAADKMRDKFKRDSFAGYTQVYYLDTSGGSRRKRGADTVPKKAAAKK